MHNGMSDICEALSQRGIAFSAIEHPPVYTIEDMDAAGITKHGSVAKNLFLRDANGKRHFLVMVEKGKRVDLAQLREAIGSTRLSFASEERLKRILGAKPGAVSPLGVLNDTQACAEIYIDADFQNSPRIGCHPNDNTATVFLSFEDLLRLIKENGNKISLIEIPQ